MDVGPVCWTSLPTGLSEWELGPCQAERSPIFPPLFLVRTAMDPTKLATFSSLTRPWKNNLQVCQSTKSIIIISKQPAAPKMQNSLLYNSLGLIQQLKDVKGSESNCSVSLLSLLSRW